MKKTTAKTRQANGQKKYKTRRRMGKEFGRHIANCETRSESSFIQEAARRETVKAQRGLSAKITQAIYAAWRKLRSPGSYAAAISYVSSNLTRAFERVADAVWFLMRQWDNLVRKTAEA